MVGLRSTIGLFFVALGLQWLVKISGGLYVAIAVHCIHNPFNGIVYSALTKPALDDARPESQATNGIGVAVAMQRPGGNLNSSTSPIQDANPADH